MDIDQKKLWWEIKEHFNLWSISSAAPFFIRYKEPLLVLTSERIHGGPGSGPGPVSPSISPGDGFLVKMDSEMLRKFFRSLNIPPPPGFPESE